MTWVTFGRLEPLVELETRSILKNTAPSIRYTIPADMR